MKNKIDMHIHSYISDGDYDTKKVVELIKESGVKTFSLTDHDNILGNFEIMDHLDEGMEFITGVEMTAYIEKGELHILGYDIDLNNKELKKELVNQDNLARFRVKMLLSYLSEVFEIKFSKEEEATLLNKKGNVGRPEVAKLLIKHSYVSSVREAFAKYLIEAHNNIKNAINYLSGEEIIALIKDAGGVPVLAHPIFLQKTIDELDEYIGELKKYGLMGIEVYHSKQSTEYSEKLLEIATKYDLLVSCGSDYHGPNVKPDVFIGKVANNMLEIDSVSLVDYIRSR